MIVHCKKKIMMQWVKNLLLQVNLKYHIKPNSLTN